jgi:hypothetical protein
MGEDSKRRAVVKECDQRDQERPTCRSRLTTEAGVSCSYHKALERRQESNSTRSPQKSKFMRGTRGLGKGTGSYVRRCVFWRDRSKIGLLKGEPPTVRGPETFSSAGLDCYVAKEEGVEKLERRQCRDAGCAARSEPARAV